MNRIGKRKGQVKLTTNIVVSRDDVSIAHNHSVYSRVTNQLERTEEWERKLKSMVQGLDVK